MYGRRPSVCRGVYKLPEGERFPSKGGRSKASHSPGHPPLPSLTSPPLPFVAFPFPLLRASIFSGSPRSPIFNRPPSLPLRGLGGARCSTAGCRARRSLSVRFRRAGAAVAFACLRCRERIVSRACDLALLASSVGGGGGGGGGLGRGRCWLFVRCPSIHSSLASPACNPCVCALPLLAGVGFVCRLPVVLTATLLVTSYQLALPSPSATRI